MNIAQRLTETFREVFNDPTLVVTPETTAKDVDGWDSFSHVNLIVAVELSFGIKFSQRELLTFRKVGDLLRSIQRNLDQA